ncbi:MAG: hypothetical protein ACLQU9_14535, partial [Acidimicrobiales bacterium]
SGQPHKRTLVTALISFIAEWRYRARLINLFEHGSREPFFLHLLRGCVLFESLLKEQAKKVLTQDTLGRILQHDLLAELGMANVQVGANNFNNDVVAGLGPNMTIEATINSTAQARNTLGHNLVWMVADLNAGTYDLLMKNISCGAAHGSGHVSGKSDVPRGRCVGNPPVRTPAIEGVTDNIYVSHIFL